MPTLDLNCLFLFNERQPVVVVSDGIWSAKITRLSLFTNEYESAKGPRQKYITSTMSFPKECSDRKTNYLLTTAAWGKWVDILPTTPGPQCCAQDQFQEHFFGVFLLTLIVAIKFVVIRHQQIQIFFQRQQDPITVWQEKEGTEIWCFVSGRTLLTTQEHVIVVVVVAFTKVPTLCPGSPLTRPQVDNRSRPNNPKTDESVN